MSAIAFAVVAGLAFGALAVGLMLPMNFPDKATALLAAFADRFAIGFLIPLVSMPVPGLVRGAVVGLLISLPSAIVTKAYIPVLVVGTAGGAIIGWLAAKFVV
jgi:small basic protein